MTVNESENMNEVHIANIPTEIEEQDETSNVGSLKLKVYKRRWLMLFIYVICAVGAMFQWLEYGIIVNIVTRYQLFFQNHTVLKIKLFYSWRNRYITYDL